MITVCIPAYRSEDFIAETVQSVLKQTLAEFRLIVTVDPAEECQDETVKVLDRFLDDPRVEVRVNPRRLGWAENVNAMIVSVETEFYVILPHDDLWLPQYLERLFGLLSTHDDASVAYADLEFFGAVSRCRKRSIALPLGEDRGLHLLRFYIQGAHAMPWRGVTRTSSLAVTGGFPSDRYRGFAVECEYALGLLEAGPVLHLPEILYRKRVFPKHLTDKGRLSASRERILKVPLEERRLAWERHRQEMHLRNERLLRRLGAPDELAILCHHALTAAMLLRRRSMVAPGLEPGEAAALREAMAECQNSSHPLAPQVKKCLVSAAFRSWPFGQEWPSKVAARLWPW